MHLEENISLQAYNTFGIEVEAERFACIFSEDDLRDVLKLGIRPLFILGGGSNVLFTAPVKGLVVKNQILGKRKLEDQAGKVLVEAGAGENWHAFVQWTLDQGLCGLENLSLIPGCVGAAPIQNIGAYGVELKDVFHSLDAIELETGALRSFRREDCAFGYRDSVFKGPLKGKYCITRVRFLLGGSGEVNTSYGAIAHTLQQMGVLSPSCRDVSEAVINIRSSKLPDPKEIGNAGSFFKNPEIDTAHFQKLQAAYPDMVAYPLPNGKVKVPAGWLIDRNGWRGKREGQVGSYEKQALVMVNFGGATGKEILDFTNRIVASVKKQFGISLEREVNVI